MTRAPSPMTPSPFTSEITVQGMPSSSDLEKSSPIDPEKGEASREPDVYDRFSKGRKRAILAIMASSALLTPLASSSFFPTIPQVAADMHTTGTVINYSAVAVFLAIIGLAPLLWAPASGYYGRRLVLLVSFPIFIAGSIGCAVSNSLGALIATRILQGFGGSSVLSVGAGSIGDCYRPTERANAMGLFYSGLLIGPAVAPTAAGLLGQYTAPGWRSMQWLLTALGVLEFVLIFVFLPETSHGVLPHDAARARTGKRFILFRFNPFQSIALLRYPNIFLMSLLSSCVMLTLYVILVPISYTMGPRYNISNAAILGCLYFPSGVGNLVGARIAGRDADRIVRKWMTKRGYRRPEDRLRATLIGGFAIMPLSAILHGFAMQYGAGGIAIPCVAMFISGLGLMLILTPSNTYLVDSLQSRSAEVVAANNAVRYLVAAGASAAVLPLVRAISLGWTMFLCACLCWVGEAFVVLVIMHGEGWRGAGPPASAAAEEAKKERENVAVQGRAPGIEQKDQDRMRSGYATPKLYATASNHA